MFSIHFSMTVVIAMRAPSLSKMLLAVRHMILRVDTQNVSLAAARRDGGPHTETRWPRLLLSWADVWSPRGGAETRREKNQWNPGETSNADPFLYSNHNSELCQEKTKFEVFASAAKGRANASKMAKLEVDLWIPSKFEGIQRQFRGRGSNNDNDPLAKSQSYDFRWPNPVSTGTAHRHRYRSGPPVLGRGSAGK